MTHQKDLGIEAFETSVRFPDVEQHVDRVGGVQVVDGLIDGHHDALDGRNRRR